MSHAADTFIDMVGQWLQRDAQVTSQIMRWGLEQCVNFAFFAFDFLACLLLAIILFSTYASTMTPQLSSNHYYYRRHDGHCPNPPRSSKASEPYLRIL
jgi:hypothetical protein